MLFVVIIDERLSKGLVRAETRSLKDSLNEHGHEIFVTLMEGIAPRFRNSSRLRYDEMNALANALYEKASQAYNPLYSDLMITSPTKGRPNAGSYEMLHVWTRPIQIPDDSHHLMQIAVFTAKGDRKNVAMSANDTLVGFYEHAAERLLQRCGTRQEAIRVIGQRLIETIILPSLALDTDGESLIETDMHIPFADGLLIGRFVDRTDERLPGGYFRIHNRQVKEGWLSSETKAQFVVKTFIGPETLSERHIWAAYQVNSWLAKHANEAETVKRRVFHPGGNLSKDGHFKGDEYEALKADFHRMRERVFGPLQR